MRPFLVLLLCACSAPEPTTPPPAAPVRAPADAAVVVAVDAAPAHGPARSATQQLVDELAAKGYKVSAGSKPSETVVCSANNCVCLAELECGAGPCITLEKNLAVFDAARKSKDRPVDCELADTGTSCDGSFFRFEGDIYRLETRFFDKSGALIGQRNATDNFEYCGGKARVRYMGAQPRCAAATNVKTICTDHKHDRPLPDPRADLDGALAH